MPGVPRRTEHTDCCIMAAPRGQDKNKAHCYTTHRMPPSQNCAQDTHLHIFFLDCTVRAVGNPPITALLSQARTSAAAAVLRGEGRGEARPEHAAVRKGPAPGEARGVPGPFQQRPMPPGAPRSPSPGTSRPAALHDRGKGGQGKKENGREGLRSPAPVPADPLRRTERSRPGGGISTARRGAAGPGGIARPGLQEPPPLSPAAEAAAAPLGVRPVPPPSSRRAIQTQPRPGRREGGHGPGGSRERAGAGKGQQSGHPSTPRPPQGRGCVC